MTTEMYTSTAMAKCHHVKNIHDSWKIVFTPVL